MWQTIGVIGGVLASYVTMAWRWWAASREADKYKRAYDVAEASNKDLLLKYSRQHDRLRALEKQYGEILRRYADQMSIDELIEFDRQLQERRRSKPE